MLKQQIEEEMKVALKAGEAVRLSTLRLLLSAINNENISLQKELTDEDILKVIAHQVKQRREAIDAYEKAGRSELAKQEGEEMAILNKYLPQQLSEDEVRKIVTEVISQLPENEKNNFGKIMGAVMAQSKGKTDGNVVSKLVKEVLS